MRSQRAQNRAMKSSSRSRSFFFPSLRILNEARTKDSSRPPSGLRFGGYGVGLYMASMYEFADQFLHGVVLADILTWIALCWFDARFNKLPVILEFVGFVALTTIVLGCEKMSVFENSTAMGMAFLGFLITLGTKGLYQLHKHWTSGSSEAE